MSRTNFDAYRDLPADEARGNPLHSWGSLHADKLGTYWTIPVDVPLKELGALRPVVQSKERLASVLAALRDGTPLEAIELGVYRGGGAWIVDGNHRLIAARKERLPTIPVRFTFVGASPVSGARKKIATRLDAEIAEALTTRRAGARPLYWEQRYVRAADLSVGDAVLSGSVPPYTAYEVTRIAAAPRRRLRVVLERLPDRDHQRESVLRPADTVAVPRGDRG